MACSDGDTIVGSGTITTRVIDTDTFHTVAVLGPMRVEIVRGLVSSVTVEADDNIIDDVTITVKDGVLTLQMDDRSYDPTRLLARVSAPALSAVRHAASDSVIVDNAFTVQAPEIIASGSGTVKVTHGDAMAFTTSSFGSGNIVLSSTGRVVSARHTCTGSGSIRAFAMPTDTVVAICTGSGNVEVTVDSLLDATLSGSGNVIYDGNVLVNLDVSATGSGRVRRR